MSLELLHEAGGQFVEYLGDIYYLGDEAELPDGFELEEGEIEDTTTLAMRRSVAACSIESQPYNPMGFNASELSSQEHTGVRTLDSENGILPDSDYIILKRLKEGSPICDSAVYRQEDNHHYCLNNGCCSCACEPVKVPAKYCIVSADIMSQEPLASTLVTREPEWVEVFELRNFRGEDPKLLQHMDIIFETQLKISKRDKRYVGFIHDTYFDDRTDLHKLNYLVSEAKQDEKNVEPLKEFISELIGKFEEYNKTLQA